MRNNGMATAPQSIYQIKVTLERSNPPIWRRLLVPNTTTLPKFHAILQAAMGWTDSHLHMFVVGQARYSMPDPEFDDPEMVDERRKPLKRLLKEKGDALVYEYDFGDGWRHRIKLERVIAPEPDMAIPNCIAGERACPPEDVGGIPGYEGFLEAILDPKHPDHTRDLEWVGGQFDPEAFDLEEANSRMPKGSLRLV